MYSLFLTHRFLPYKGGSEKYFYQLCKDEIKRGNRVKVFTSTCKDLNCYFSSEAERFNNKKEIIDGIEIYRIDNHPFKYSKRLSLYLSQLPLLRDYFGGAFVFYPQFLLKTLFSQRQYNRIYAGPLPFIHTFTTAYLRKKIKSSEIIGVPLMHPPLPLDKTRETEYIKHIHILNRMDRIITLSVYEKDYIKSLGVKVPIDVVIPKIEVDYNIEPYVTDMPYFLQISYIDKRKGTLDLMKAMEYLWEKKKDIKVIFVGRVSPDMKEEFDVFKDKYSRYIEHYIDIDDKFKYSLIKGSITLVMVSIAESFGYVYGEAIKLGKKPVGAYYGFIPDIWKDKMEYVPYGHPYLLMEAMENYL